MHPDEFINLAAEARKRINEVTPAIADALSRTGALVIDVRDKDAYDQQHIKGAVNISSDDISASISTVVPDKSASIVCYCFGGNRGALAADILNSMGYTNVVSIRGGLNAYVESKT